MQGHFADITGKEREPRRKSPPELAPPTTRRVGCAETLNALRTAAADDRLAAGLGWLEDSAYRERARSALGLASDAQ